MFVLLSTCGMLCMCDMILFSGHSSLRDYYMLHKKKIFQVFVSVSFFKSDNLNSKQMFVLVIKSCS